MDQCGEVEKFNCCLKSLTFTGFSESESRPRNYGTRRDPPKNLNNTYGARPKGRLMLPSVVGFKEN